MIDLHTHVLPGLDDGPASMDTSLALARAAAAAGTRTMVATPHIDYAFDVDPAVVRSAVERLQAELTRERVNVTVLAGGEIATTRLPDLSPEELDLVRLGERLRRQVLQREAAERQGHAGLELAAAQFRQLQRAAAEIADNPVRFVNA